MIQKMFLIYMFFFLSHQLLQHLLIERDVPLMINVLGTVYLNWMFANFLVTNFTALGSNGTG